MQKKIGTMQEGQRTGKIHSLYGDKEARHREELRGGSKPEVVEDEDKALTETIKSMQERSRLSYRREQEEVYS